MKIIINILLSIPAFFVLLPFTLQSIDNLLTSYSSIAVVNDIMTSIMNLFMGQELFWLAIIYAMMFSSAYTLVISIAKSATLIARSRLSNLEAQINHFNLSYFLNAVTMVVIGQFAITLILFNIFPGDDAMRMRMIEVISYTLPLAIIILASKYILKGLGLKCNSHLGIFKMNISIHPLILIISILIFIVSVNMLIDTMPDIYTDIKFGDKYGKYIVNYDGDYWLTYYIDKNSCYKTPGSLCYPDWVKKGNASIMESPVDLKPFIDKEVAIDAYPKALDYNKKYPTTKPDTCIVRSTFDKVCTKSTGPGSWELSPLVIKSINFAK